MSILFDDGSIVFDDGGVVFADDPEDCDCCEPQGEDCTPWCEGNSTGRVRITITGVVNNGAVAASCDILHDCDKWNDTFVLPDDFLPSPPPTLTCHGGFGRLYDCTEVICSDADTASVRTIGGVAWTIALPGGGGNYAISVGLDHSWCTGVEGIELGNRGVAFRVELAEEEVPDCLNGIYVLDFVPLSVGGTDSLDVCDFTGATVTLEFI